MITAAPPALFQGHLIRVHRNGGKVEDLGDMRHEFRLAPFEDVLVEWHEAMDYDSIEADDLEGRDINQTANYVVDRWDRRSPISFTVATRTTFEVYTWWPDRQSRRPAEWLAENTTGTILARPFAWLAEVTK